MSRTAIVAVVDVIQVRMLAAVASCPLSVVELPQVHSLFPTAASPFFLSGALRAGVDATVAFTPVTSPAPQPELTDNLDSDNEAVGVTSPVLTHKAVRIDDGAVQPSGTTAARLASLRRRVRDPMPVMCWCARVQCVAASSVLATLNRTMALGDIFTLRSRAYTHIHTRTHARTHCVYRVSAQFLVSLLEAQCPYVAAMCVLLGISVSSVRRDLALAYYRAGEDDEAVQMVNMLPPGITPA
jgi:hypothetical protein